MSHAPKMDTNTTDRSENSAAPGVGSGALFGILTRAGDLTVNEEADCGLVVSMKRDDLRAAKYLPMYRPVKLVTAEEWNAALALRDHLIGALREIQRAWNIEAEACADNSAVAAKMARTATSALLSLPNKADMPTCSK
jgi:hypothetical protein